MNIVIWLIVGGLVGLAVSRVWHDPEGLLRHVAVGIVGALLAGWLLAPTFAAGTIHSGDFSLIGLAVSLLGAVSLLAVVNLARLGSALSAPARELTRTLLGVISLGALIVASVWILPPFLAAVVWAAMIAAATWPAMLWLQARLWRRRALAVSAMTVILLLVFVAPLALAIGTIVLNADEIVARVKAIAAFRMPTPPEWLAGLPFIGAKSSWHGNRRPPPVWKACWQR